VCLGRLIGGSYRGDLERVNSVNAYVNDRKWLAVERVETMKKHVNGFVVCLIIAAMSVICVACSIKAGDTDPDRTSDAETSVVETETPEETTAETTKKKVKETSPTAEESTAAITADASETSGGAEITPPAERVYPITSEDAIAVFEALGLESLDMETQNDTLEKQVFALDSANKYLCGYYSFTKESYAQDYLKLMQETFAANNDTGSFEGTSDITEEDGYSKLVVSGKYENDARMYLVAICVDKVVITGYTMSNEKIDMEFIDSCFIGLGY